MEESVQFKLLQLIFFIAFLLLPSIQAQDLFNQFNRNCTNENYQVKTTRATVYLDPVVGGRRITITLSLFTDQVILEGVAVIDLSFHGVHFHSEMFNLCNGGSCPISSGNFVRTMTQVLPVYVSPGSYNFMMKLYNGDGRQLSCDAFDFTIPNPRLVSDL